MSTLLAVILFCFPCLISADCYRDYYACDVECSSGCNVDLANEDCAYSCANFPPWAIALVVIGVAVCIAVPLIICLVCPCCILATLVQNRRTRPATTAVVISAAPADRTSRGTSAYALSVQPSCPPYEATPPFAPYTVAPPPPYPGYGMLPPPTPTSGYATANQQQPQISTFIPNS